MDNALVCLVVFIGEKDLPIGREAGRIDGEAVVLRGDETSVMGVLVLAGSVVGTRLVVTAVTVPQPLLVIITRALTSICRSWRRLPEP